MEMGRDSISENEQSMPCAGDIPGGSYAHFMKTDFDCLVEEPVGAAQTNHQAVGFYCM
jgi:hypothetical protein